MRRTALYNNQRHDMDDVDPQLFLDEALVPNYPDLRGASWSERTEGNETIFEFFKRAGQKGSN